MGIADKVQLLQLLQAKLARQEKAREAERLASPAWMPHPKNKPQTEAFHSDAYIVGYGGAAGGGKTALAIGKALMQHRKAMFVRSEAVDLESVIEWITSNITGKMNHVSAIFRPASERGVKAHKIKFTHLSKSRGGVKSKQGNDYDYIVFEEATNLNEDLVRTMLAWLRTTDAGQKCQAVLTFNPPLTPEGMWVASMFAPWVDESHPLYPVPSGQVLHVAMIGNEEIFSHEPQLYTHHPVTGIELLDTYGNPAPQSTKSRVFFRATVQDNPFMSKEYIDGLMQLPADKRDALLYGHMTGSIQDAIGQIIKKEHYNRAKRRWAKRVEEDDPRKLPPTVISIDLAEGGGDRTVITPVWHGGFIGEPHVIQGVDVNSGADNVRALADYMLSKWGVNPETSTDARGAQTTIIYDGLSACGGAFGSEIAHMYPDADVRRFIGSTMPGIRGVFGAESYDISPRSGLPVANGKGSFSNKITAAWARFGQMLEHDAFAICVPPGLALQRELLSRVFAEVKDTGNTSQKAAIESKAAYKKRLQNSPDLADSVIMGLWMLYLLGLEE